MQARTIGTYRVTIEGRDALGYHIHVKQTTNALNAKAAIVKVEVDACEQFNIEQVTKAQAKRML
jgi:hypothetical protein